MRNILLFSCLCVGVLILQASAEKKDKDGQWGGQWGGNTQWGNGGQDLGGGTYQFGNPGYAAADASAAASASGGAGGSYIPNPGYGNGWGYGGYQGGAPIDNSWSWNNGGDAAAAAAAAAAAGGSGGNGDAGAAGAAGGNGVPDGGVPKSRPKRKLTGRLRSGGKEIRVYNSTTTSPAVDKIM